MKVLLSDRTELAGSVYSFSYSFLFFSFFFRFPSNPCVVPPHRCLVAKLALVLLWVAVHCRLGIGTGVADSLRGLVRMSALSHCSIKGMYRTAGSYLSQYLHIVGIVVWL